MAVLVCQQFPDRNGDSPLAKSKLGFRLDLEHLNPSQTFEDFHGWPGSLCLSFRRGIHSKLTHEDLMSLQQQQDGTAKPKS